MKINLENKQDLGAHTLRHITYMKKQLKEKYREYNTPLCVALLDLLSTNPSNIDIITRTRNRRCVHMN